MSEALGAAQVPPAGEGLVDLASRRLGAGVVAANDETFAAKENLIRPQDPVHHPGTFDHRGQVYDGWETRRRREPGSDWVVVRLGSPGLVHAVVVDTAFFTGNYPQDCEVHACWLDGFPSAQELAGPDVTWTPLVGRSPLRGDTRNTFAVDEGVRGVLASHVRLTIRPDGGVARLRVLGEVVPDPRRSSGSVMDLAAVGNGARLLDCSDRYFSSPANLLLPGEAATMGEGWETRRRRGSGNDWVLVQLAGPAHIHQVIVDTTHFVGNAPGAVSLRGFDARGAGGTARESGESGEGTEGGNGGADPSCWHELLPRTRVQPDTPHWFNIAAGPASQPVTHVRLDAFPDGGLARLRLHGELTADGRAGVCARWWSALPVAAAQQQLARCCASSAWAAAVVAGRPYPDAAAMLAASDAILADVPWSEVREALDAHPRIGDPLPPSGRDADWSRQEQSGVDGADERLRRKLADGNADYEQRFGYTYLVCATGRSGEEMLALLRQRLTNDPGREQQVVRKELAAITGIRLRRLLDHGGVSS